MRIGITFDLKSAAPLPAHLPDDYQEEFDSQATVDAIASVLRGLGHEVVELGDGRAMLERVLASPPDFVFNIAEGHGIGRSREARVPAVLEMLGIPYTGSDPLTLSVTLDKDCARRLVRSHGVAVPEGFIVWPSSPLADLDSSFFPAIVKPAWEGSSKGICGKSVVDDAVALRSVVAELLQTHGQPVLVEEFIEGEELTVGLIGNKVIGVMRVMPIGPRERFVYSLEVKRDFRQRVTYECPARLPVEQLQLVQESALRAYHSLGCRDVARIDFRLRNGVPYFLEVNPLPGLNPDTSDLVIMAGLVGLSHGRLVESILSAALERVAAGVFRDRPEWNRPNADLRPTVMVLYNEPMLPADHCEAASEHEILATTDIICRTLAQADFAVTRLGVGREPQSLLTGLRAGRPDVVFNLFEGLATHGNSEASVAGLLEWLEIPFTGSPAPALALAHDKIRTKQILRGAGLPTPAFFLVDQLPGPLCTLQWPVIVKPALQDASVGIEQGSVVTNQEQLNQRLAHVLERYGAPVLVEEFIRGREFHVTLVEEEARNGVPPLYMLPLAEIVFEEKDPAYWPIYSYDAKWKTDGREYLMTPLRSPVILEAERTERLAGMAREAFRLVGCRDYARLDVRMTPAGQFSFLEVNPNPFINSAGIINGLNALGRTHAEFVVSLVRSAMRRGRCGSLTPM